MWIKSSTTVALLSAVSGTGETLPVTPCDSEWGRAVATQVKAAGAEVQCPVTPPSTQTSSDPSTQTAVAPPARPASGAGGDGGFLWWPIVAAVAGVCVTALAIFFIVAAYRRRDRRRVVAATTADSAAAGEPAWQLPAESRAMAARAAEVDSRATLAHAMRGARLGWLAEPVPLARPLDGESSPRADAAILKKMKKMKKKKKSVVQATDEAPPPAASGGSASVVANAVGITTRAKLTWVASSPPQQSVPVPPSGPSAGLSRARLFKRASGARLGSEHLVTDATLDEGIVEITMASATGHRR